jgi:protein-S-isoprenylcysteine O-methyltransferase Ste14
VNRRKVISIFFLGLVVMLSMEIFLIWIFSQVEALPYFDLGWVNSLVGLPAVILGALLIIWSVRILYTEGKGTPYPKAATRKLVTTGPYAFTRNPMTLGAVVFYLGIAVWAKSSLVIAIVLFVFVGLLRYIYIHETRELAARFGEEYLEYRHKTPFLFPRLSRHNS